MLEIRTRQESKITYLMLLFFVYLFSFFDLVITVYVSIHYGLYEVNPIYSSFGWFVFIMYKFFVPLLFYFFSVKYRVYFPLYILLFLLIFICFWNLYVILKLNGF